uniref:C1q and TNF related 5 n=2 Tax=Lates calcarifer TaxID=8187 RepID=A0A4W6CUE3_LATCA
MVTVKRCFHWPELKGAAKFLSVFPSQTLWLGGTASAGFSSALTNISSSCSSSQRLHYISHRDTAMTSLRLLPVLHSLLVLQVHLSNQLEDNKIPPSLCTGHPGIPGSPGAHGSPGQPGRDGRDGRDAAPGEKGQKGDRGDTGETGVRGLTGDRGDPGEKGERGQPGECAVAPKSAFSAKLSEGLTLPLTVGDAVRFDKIMLNEQGDYNTETGRFTCKVPGVYYFAVHATVYRASLQFDLMKNGHTVASYFQFYGNWPKPASLSGGSLLHLVPGDQVWVQMALSEYNGFYSSTKTDSTFTGFLVYSDWKNSAVFA